jgi:hypothetical protein
VPGINVQDLLARLRNVKRSGEGYVALCPAHDDHHHSLSIGEGDRGIVLNCHAGCKPEDVARSIDMELRDLFYEERPAHRVVAEYEYRDEDNVLRYVVERRDPKDFRQRRPDGSGGWVWNLKGITPLPYKLPEILAADLGEPILIVEGEKDVDELQRRGFFATCNSGGAGKWRPELSKWFAGRRVVIIPDNDDAGRKHAERVHELLAGVAADRVILELPALPPKGDVADWLAAGHTSDELRELFPKPDAESIDRFVFVHECDDPPPQEWVWDGWIPKDFVTILYAMGGSSKSFMSQYIGMQIAMNKPVFGQKVTGGPVLFLDGELDRDSWLRRGFMFARGMKLERLPSHLVYRRVRTSLLDPKVRSEVLSFIKAERPVLTIIDSFTACLPGVDTNSMDDIVTRMKAIEDFGSVLLIDHTKKTSDVGDSTPIGSVAKWNFARSAIQLSAGKEGGTVMKQTKSNFGKLCDPIAYTLNVSGGHAHVDLLSFSDERLEGVEGVLPAKQRIAHTFRSDAFPNGATSKDLAEHLGITEKTVRNKAAQLVREGLLTKDGRVWRPAPSPGWSAYESK